MTDAEYEDLHTAWASAIIESQRIVAIFNSGQLVEFSKDDVLRHLPDWEFCVLIAMTVASKSSTSQLTQLGLMAL